jgi:RNA polymerase sporulation-specific sigma factor
MRPAAVSSHDLAALTDNDLIVQFREGQIRAFDVLLERYIRFIQAKARGFFLVGADIDDVRQEALIGFHKAVRDYSLERESSFRSFAELCVTRQIHTAIKAANRLKHQAMKGYTSFSYYQDLEPTGLEAVWASDATPGPEERIILIEATREVQELLLATLSSFESRILELKAEGLPYEEISARLDCRLKSVDNALHRIRKKLNLLVLRTSSATDAA